ncbi:hypothetical protein DV738_g1629, partial [Chaetothyriales sp. CBS 135597]
MDRDRERHYPNKRPYDGGHSGHSSHSGTPKKQRFNHYESKSKPNLPPLPAIAEKWQSPVFTHPSQGNQELAGGPMQSYDRLEFLGDAYLEIIATRALWKLGDTGLSAARMAALREGMVKNETLSQYAVAYGFDKKLKIGDGSRPTRRDAQIKVNGDVFEAYVAAVVLSTAAGGEKDFGGTGLLLNGDMPGFKIAEDWLTKLWTTSGKLRDVSRQDDVTSKGILQKKIGGKGVYLNYVEERERIVHIGKGIEQYFVGVYLTGWGYENQHLGSGEGLSKKAAGMAAAKDALDNNTKLLEEVEKGQMQIDKSGNMSGNMSGNKSGDDEQ